MVSGLGLPMLAPAEGPGIHSFERSQLKPGWYWAVAAQDKHSDVTQNAGTKRVFISLSLIEAPQDYPRNPRLRRKNAQPGGIDNGFAAHLSR